MAAESLNGFRFPTVGDSYIVIPPEMLGLILSYVDIPTLRWNCRRVCQSWKSIINESVWKIIAERNFNRRFVNYYFNILIE